MDIRYTIAYIIIIVLFLIVELKGVFDKRRGDTLSENVWWLERRVWPLRIVFGLFCIWLFVHFVFLGRFG